MALGHSEGGYYERNFRVFITLSDSANRLTIVLNSGWQIASNVRHFDDESGLRLQNDGFLNKYFFSGPEGLIACRSANCIAAAIDLKI